MTFFIQSYFVKEALEKFKVVFRDKVPVIEKRSKDEHKIPGQNVGRLSLFTCQNE